MAITKEQQDAIYWLALEKAEAMDQGNVLPYVGDVAALYHLLPLLRRDQADTISSLISDLKLIVEG